MYNNNREQQVDERASERVCEREQIAFRLVEHIGKHVL